MTNPVTRCPFIADKMLTESQFFVGREAEIKEVMGLMTNAQAISVNIVGARRIGKSSLLYRIYQDYENLVVSHKRQPTEFIAVYLSLADARCQGVDNFYQVIADKLLARQSVQANPNLADPLRVQPFDGMTFNRAMEAWKNARVLPVICLDDFESLLKNVRQFNDGFYDNLRSLVNHNLLMLVIASRSKIEDYRRQYNLTSNFFSLLQHLELKVFTDAEALDLVRLPSGNPALSDTRQKTGLAWGENHPFRLQLACRCLWEARQQDRPEGWAQQQFKAADLQITQSGNIIKSAVGAVARLGSLGQKIGNSVDDLGNFFKGMAIIAIISLVLCGTVPWSELAKYLQTTVNDILENAKTDSKDK